MPVLSRISDSELELRIEEAKLQFSNPDLPTNERRSAWNNMRYFISLRSEEHVRAMEDRM
jgi:hypothetical protein